MSDFKNTEISWIGDIPKSWELKKLKYLTTKIERGTSPEYTDDEMTMVVNQATFSKGFFDTSNIRFSTKPARSSRGLLKKEDVLLASTGGGVLGKTHLYLEDDEYVADSHVTIIRVDNAKLNAEYLYYFLSVNYDTINAMLAIGSTNQTELQRDLLANMKVPLPSLNEQSNIAKYLREKCAEINALIFAVRSQIELLEKYKRSVITESVTKGLTSDVEMKDSGIEWVGLIPTHWPVHPVYTYFGERKNKNRFGTEDNLLSLSYGKVIRKDINTSDGLLPESFNTYNIVEAGDIIIRPTDLQNDKRSLRTGLVKEHGIITSAYIGLYPIKKVDSRFFHYLLHAYDVMKVFYNMGNGVRQGLNYSEFSRLMVFEPTYDEQVAIADYLDGKIAEIDSIIAQKKEQLSVLEAYKKSLLFEYVTGKKEVPAPITAVMVDPNVILLGKLPKLLSKQKGKIYNQKVLYLLNTYLGLNLGVQYYRYKHGPYDVMLDSYIDTLVENGWCVKTTNNGAEYLEIGPNYGAFEEKYGSHFSEHDAEINSLIQFVQPMKRSQIERIATLFAVWNDMILDGNSTPTDTEIVSEVMSGWTENKANFAYDTWLGTLNKMRTNGIIPKGQGLHTLPRDC